MNVQDVGCIHDTYSEDTYDSTFEETNNVFDFDYVRYVLEENGLRLWTDEIPYDFFVEKFPDYVQEVSKGGAVDLSIRLSDRYKHNFVNEDYLNSSNREMIRLTSFLSLLQYNTHRDLLGKSFPKSKGGPINQGLSIDGKFVWVPTEKQYNAFQKDYVGKIPGCENIDILVPETREDLMASGINVEKYDEMCEKVFGGAKMEKNKSQDHMS